MIFSSSYAAAASETTTRPRAKRPGAFVLAVVAALAVSACTGVQIGPVDHSCPVINSCQHAGGR
jgi:hypothetical protein